MATVLAYRNDGEAPFCEMLLENGERIAISLSAAGVLIESLPSSKASREALFHGSPDDVAWICATIGEGRPAKVLDVIVSIAARLGSAEHVRSAFAAAAAVMC